MVRTACLVCFISTVNGAAKKQEKKPITSGTSSGHITKLKQSLLLRCLWLGLFRTMQSLLLLLPTLIFFYFETGDNKLDSSLS
jgi:hypothetical protein